MSEVKCFCPKSKQVSREKGIQSRVLAQHPRHPSPTGAPFVRILPHTQAALTQALASL